MPNDPTQRFSDRVDDYRRYRPGYPESAFEYLVRLCRLSPDDAIADVGAGTGLSAEPWLKRGYRVHAVEPNGPMRAAAKETLGAFPKLELVDAAAEDLPFADSSLGLITVAQAFHWFDGPVTRREFARVLKPGALVALIWNERLAGSPLMQDYDKALETYACDYASLLGEARSIRRILDFFTPGPVTERRFDNRQVFDLDGFLGRVWSASYAPPADHPNYEPLRAELARLFDLYASDNRLVLPYRTRVFTGRLQ